MRALVVYESMYGNTKRIAQSIAGGLLPYLTATVVTIDDVGDALDSEVTLLVVGGPTHAHGLSRRGTRDTAARGAKEVQLPRRGLREWLDALPPANGDIVAATFDTRLTKPRWITGSAAVGAGRKLRRRGYRLAVPPESFFVSEATGPLMSGEMERARSWGEQLGSTVIAASSPERR